MIHETVTFTLVGSKKWDLLLRQIKLARKQGMSAENIYHLMDRFPGAIRKDLHDFFRAEGDIITDPVFKRHVNPNDLLFLDDLPSENAPYVSIPMANRVQSLENMPAVGATADVKTLVTSSFADEDKRLAKDAFSRQFKQSDGMNLFAEKFMPDDAVAGGSFFDDEADSFLPMGSNATKTPASTQAEALPLPARHGAHRDMLNDIKQTLR